MYFIASLEYGQKDDFLLTLAVLQSHLGPGRDEGRRERKNKQYKERGEGEIILLVIVNVVGVAELRIDCPKD